MAKNGRSKADRRFEDSEWRKRDREYRAMARELHREWCERMEDLDDAQGDIESSEEWRG